MPGPEKGLDEVAEWGPAGEPLRTAAQIIIDYAAEGLPAEISSQIAGVSLRTYRSWLQEGRAVLARIAAQPDIELSEKEARIAQFATDVGAGLARWVASANGVLQANQYRRQRITTRTKETALRNAAGEESGLVEVERTTTVVEEPIELGPLQWRLAKIAPAVYGPVSRLELTGADGGPVTVDIGARVEELLARLRSNITVEDEQLEPGEPELLSLEPGEPDGPVV